MRQKILKTLLLSLVMIGCMIANAQTMQYTMPAETDEHEGTWIQWPHNYMYGPWYRDDVESTFIEMVNALQVGENVHIIAYDSTELSYITNVLTTASIPFTNIDFFVHQTDDVWSRDNGPMFVYDQNNDLTILDWGFNGWGFDVPYSKCDVIPQSVSMDIGIPRIDLNGMVLEGGAIEHDGNGTMMATRSSVTHSSRNPSLTEAQIEDTLTTYMGITKFIWLDGVYGQDITDMHIDGYVKFANDSTIVTMDSTDLDYWYVSGPEIDIIYNATNTSGDSYNIVIVPLTQNDVLTTIGTNLGYKGSYCNYYIANDVVLVPTYNDPNDASALAIIQGIYPNRTVIGIDVRNLYEYGGMIHCITQQQPIDLNSIGLLEPSTIPFQLLQNSPNPFDEFTTIRFSVEGNSLVTLDIYNALGQNVATHTPDYGEQKVVLSSADFENGIYLYTLKINGKIVGSNKMVINK
jgi:agmatine deiminase